MRTALFLLLLSACRRPAELGSQPAVNSWLVVHVEPISRASEEGCQTEDLQQCGRPVAASWEQRSKNLSWLASEWSTHQRTMDLQLGPEMSLAWSEEPEIVGALVDDYGLEGDPEGVLLDSTKAAARVAEVAAAARSELEGLTGSGTAALGVHVHSTLPDGEGGYGSAPKTGEGSACGSWEEDPLTDSPPAIVEEVVHYGVDSADRLAALLAGDPPLQSFTGHLPQTMANKALLIAQPDALDPDIARAWPTRFRPADLGSAYTECMHQAVDHPPFERYPAHDSRALGAGEGPPVVPGERAIGTVTEHLDARAETSVGAAERRFLELLLNWRVAALRGETDHDWTWTFHTHLFLLGPGSPRPQVEADRDLQTRTGNALRGDIEEFGAFLDGFAGLETWQGVAAEEGAVLDWTTPAAVDRAAGTFSYGEEGEAPPEEMEEAVYPYLPLLAERLAESHLACTGAQDHLEIYGFSRCPSGWGWGGGPDLSGYHCLDGSQAEGLFVLVPDRETCAEVPAVGLKAAGIDAADLGAGDWCSQDSLRVPVEGLLVEPVTGLAWLADRCSG